MSLLELFCHVDDFCRQFVPEWRQLQLTSGVIQRQRSTQLSLSEIMTILIWFHCSHYRTFKAYYTEEVQRHLRAQHPALIRASWNSRRPRWCPCSPICRPAWGHAPAFPFSMPPRWRSAIITGIAQHHVFRGVAQRGKTSTGWFFGFKLHLLVNDRSEHCSISPSPPEIPMIGDQYLSMVKELTLARSSPTKATCLAALISAVARYVWPAS